MDILDWFKVKYQEVQQKFNLNRKPEINKNKRVRM
jgi:hypothetical protein